MKLLLSSDALPGSGFGELQEAVRRRAFAGLELTVGAGQAHGVDPSLCPIRQKEHLDCVPEGAQASVDWLRLPAEVSLQMLMVWAAAAHTMRAGLLLAGPVPEVPDASTSALIHGTSLEDAAAAVRWAESRRASTCWEVDLHRSEPELMLEVLELTGPRLAHVRLLGGGPEPASGSAGTLISRLALRGYGGTIAVAPSSPAHLGAWKRWLFERKGWGCGTAAEKAARRRQEPEPSTEQTDFDRINRETFAG